MNLTDEQIERKFGAIERQLAAVTSTVQAFGLEFGQVKSDVSQLREQIEHGQPAESAPLEITTAGDIVAIQSPTGNRLHLSRNDAFRATVDYKGGTVGVKAGGWQHDNVPYSLATSTVTPPASATTTYYLILAIDADPITLTLGTTAPTDDQLGVKLFSVTKTLATITTYSTYHIGDIVTTSASDLSDIPYSALDIWWYDYNDILQKRLSDDYADPGAPAAQVGRVWYLYDWTFQERDGRTYTVLHMKQQCIPWS